MGSQTKLFYLLFLLCFLSSCSLFENEQIPDCLKKSRKAGPDIVHCDQPVYFGRPDWHPGGEWIAAEHSDSLDTDEDGVKDTLFSGIWLVNAQTGITQPLLPFGDAPAWNPAGTHLAVHAGGGIYTVEIKSLYPAQYDTASITLLTDFDAPAFFPTWSGDGEWIAFDSNYKHDNGAYLIWKANNDGSNLKKVNIQEVGGARNPNWSQSIDKITYTSYANTTASGPEIFIINIDGTNVKQLTNSQDNHFPKFSPNGEKISYTHQMPYESHVVVMNADGGNKRVITNNHSRDAAWSPDGGKLVYVYLNFYEAVPGNGQLWIMDSDGKNKKQLTNFISNIP